MFFTKIKELTRLEQTLFGLPYLCSAFLLSLPIDLRGGELFLRCSCILAAFFFARISGMAFNQFIDRHIDARNPRTCQRLLPSGRFKESHAKWIAWGSLIAFLLCIYPLPLICKIFAPLAGCMIVFYSYMKRLHVACHFVLGFLHFLSPILCSAAFKGEPTASSVFLGMAAFFTVSANDIVYAFQDYAFDLKEGLFSMPAKLGLEKSLFLVRFLHAGVLLSLFGLGVTSSLSHLYFFLIPCAALVFALFHWKLQMEEKIEPLFFMANTGIAFLILGFIWVGVQWHAM